MNKKELLRKEIDLDNLFPQVDGEIFGRIRSNLTDKIKLNYLRDNLFGLYFDDHVYEAVHCAISGKMVNYDLHKTKY